MGMQARWLGSFSCWTCVVVLILWGSAGPGPSREACPTAGPDSRALPRDQGLAASRAVDLSVTFIERTPRYERYRVSYFMDQSEGRYPFPNDRGPQALNASARHNPVAGEVVRFTAHVRNQGGEASGPVPYEWSIDGRVVGRGGLAPVRAGSEATAVMAWRWLDGSHTIRFSVRSGDAFPQNDALEDRIDGYFLQILIDRPLYERFARVRNLVGTFSFEDWLQAQVRETNGMFRRSTYDVAPRGVLTGFRVDRIRVVEASRQFARDASFDGEWRFRDVPDWPQVAVGRLDWGAIHEWMHQVGIPDLYQMNLVWERNLISDRFGNPYLKEAMQPGAGLMGGGSIAPHRSDGRLYLDRHTVVAMNRSRGHRAGFFGDYVWDTPARVRIKLTDVNGRPLPGATVSAYAFNRDTQKARALIGLSVFYMADPPCWKRVTDAAGGLDIPNQPAPAKGPTARGHVLRANPYGDLDVGTSNGVLLLKVEHGSAVDMVGLYVCQLNLACWAGQRDVAVVPLATRIGSPRTGWEGRRIQVVARSCEAHLTFDRVDHADAYEVFCGRQPEPRRYARAVRTPRGDAVIRGLEPGATYHYQVTACAGREIHPMAYQGRFVAR